MIVFTIFLLFLCRGIAANSDDACNGQTVVLTNYRGYIYSPGYLDKQPYPDGVECGWDIYSREGYKIHLKINDLDLDEVSQCAGDSLVILNANHGSEANVLCGKQILNDFISRTNRLHIRFQSDYIYAGRGFNLSYSFTARDSPCLVNQVECINRKCVDRSILCDGIDDCGDDSDERFCRGRSLTPQTYECGVPTIPPVLHSSSRVVGGQVAVEGSWPWQMDIQLKMVEPNGHTCGGALIAPRYALTAAHCLDGKREPKHYRLVFGNHGRFASTGHEQVRYIDRYVIYPDIIDRKYIANPNLKFDLDDDFALIRLSSPVKITDRVKPICLPKSFSDIPVGSECYSTGWGRTQGTGGSDVLKQLQLFVDSGEACEAKGHYNATRICVVSKGQESGLCSGDSGGPLVCQENNKWYLRGIVSHLSKGSMRGPVCGMENEGMTFAKISTRITWINQLIGIFDRLNKNP